MAEVVRVTLNDGHKVPLLGLGTARLSNPYQAVSTALELGYRHIDTAAMYGNEEEVGQAVKDSGIPREEIFITTKLNNHDHGDVEGAFEASLKRLDCGYVDLYLIHWPMPKRLDSWKTLVKMRNDEAPIKSLGVSNFTIRHMEELLAQSDTVPAVNQVEFNPFINQRELLAYNQGKGILLEAYSPLSLAGKLDNETLKKIAEARGKSPAQVMLRWSLQQGVAVIPKAQQRGHQEANIDVFGWELAPGEIDELKGLYEGHRTSMDPAGFK